MLMPSENIGKVNPSPSAASVKHRKKVGSGMTPTSSENNTTTKLKKASSYVSSINGDDCSELQ